MLNGACVTKHDSVAAIDSLWPQVVAKAGLSSAELLSSSYFDLARRVYVIDERVYKITLLEYETTSRLRTLDLQGEFAVLKRCAGIPGVPTVIDWQRDEDFELLVIERMAGEPLERLRIGRFLLVLCKLCVINSKLACRGVSHNDIKNENVLLANDGKVSLIDFDQATVTGLTAGITRSLFGIKIGEEKVHGSLMTMLKEFLKQKLPPVVLNFLKRFGGRKLDNELPLLPEDASSNVRMLVDAWRIAQVSDASSPKVLEAYYSFCFEGYYFPGERSWEDRWEVLRSITNYSDKRILELGCNMSLLSCFLLREGQATAAMGVDIDPGILKSAKLVSTALGVGPEYRQQDFDSQSDWENELKEFGPDIVFALNVLNWVRDKERFLNFLGLFDEIIFEGHDDFETEKNRFVARGYRDVELISITERERPVIHCRK